MRANHVLPLGFLSGTRGATARLDCQGDELLRKRNIRPTLLVPRRRIDRTRAFTSKHAPHKMNTKTNWNTSLRETQHKVQKDYIAFPSWTFYDFLCPQNGTSSAELGMDAQNDFIAEVRVGALLSSGILRTRKHNVSETGSVSKE
jgi:hypothetical protein